MNLAIPQNLLNDLGVPQIVDLRRELPVNQNYTWAQLAGVRELNDLTTIAIHHDALKKSATENLTDIQLATNIAKSHIRLTSNEPKGDAGHPYHIWIRNGTAYYCNNIEDRTYGVAGNNGYTVHVCVSGEYSATDALTDADRKCLYAVILTLIDALPAYEGIKGHGELNPTKCPGFDMQRIREDVATLNMKLLQQASWQGKLDKIKDLANQYNYMTNLINKGEQDGNAQWAMNQLLDVHAVLKERNLL